MKTVEEILLDGADTYRKRHKIYGDNYKKTTKILQVLWPNGAPKETVETDEFNLFMLVLIKLSRFANSNLTHEDSIHDCMVYCAMIGSSLNERGEM